LTSALDGEWSASRPGGFNPGKIAPVPIGKEAVWTQRRSGRGVHRKIFHLLGFESRPSSP
jgi:hypothetical protein